MITWIPPGPEVDGAREERGEHLRRHPLVLRAPGKREHARSGSRRAFRTRARRPVPAPALGGCRSGFQKRSASAPR